MGISQAGATHRRHQHQLQRLIVDEGQLYSFLLRLVALQSEPAFLTSLLALLEASIPSYLLWPSPSP